MKSPPPNHGLSDHGDIATVEKPLSTIVPVTELFRLFFSGHLAIITRQNSITTQVEWWRPP